MITSLPELYFRIRRFILLVQTKKWFLWTMAAAQAAENHGDEWDLTWYFLWGIYTSIWKTWHPIVNLMESQWKAVQKAKSVPEIHCYVFNITLPWIKIWRWWCRRCLHNHGFLLYEKFQCVKFRHAEVIHKKLFFHFFFFFLFFFFLKCTIVSDIYEHDLI